MNFLSPKIKEWRQWNIFIVLNNFILMMVSVGFCKYLNSYMRKRKIKIFSEKQTSKTYFFKDVW